MVIMAYLNTPLEYFIRKTQVIVGERFKNSSDKFEKDNPFNELLSRRL